MIIKLVSNPLFWTFLAVCFVVSSSRLFIIYTYRKHLISPKHMPNALLLYAKDTLSLFQITDISIRSCDGIFTDRFYPRRVTLCISQTKSSLCSLAVLLHECGHAILYARRNIAYRIFYSLSPAINSSAWLTIPLFLLTLIFNQLIFTMIAVGIFIAIFAFHFFGFAVELWANHYAKRAAIVLGFVSADDMIPFLSLLFASSLVGLASIFQVFSTSIKFIGRIIVGSPECSVREK